MPVTKLDRASVTAIKTCMGAKPGEKLLIISDPNKHEIGYNLFTNALKLGFHAQYVEMPVLKTNGQEPPPQIAHLMQLFDVVFIPTTTSLTHTAARRNASALGVRVATFPNITRDVMIRGLSADYTKIARLSVKLKGILEQVKNVKVTTPAGTDISFSIEGRHSFASKGLFHDKGESGNLPTGETYVAPVEGTANGVIVVDGSMAALGVMKRNRINIEVSNGLAVNIYGSPAAAKLRVMLDSVGPLARTIAEFGIGTNDTAKISGVLLEDEKVLGTVHLALGNNKSMGGDVDVPIHLDGVLKKPDVWIDGKRLMKEGKLLVK